MNKKENEKGLASFPRCEAFFLSEGFEAAVYQIPHLGQKSCQSFRLRATLSSGNAVCGGVVLRFWVGFTPLVFWPCGFSRQIPLLPLKPAVETVEKVLFQNGALESGTSSSKSTLFSRQRIAFVTFAPVFVCPVENFCEEFSLPRVFRQSRWADKDFHSQTDQLQNNIRND